MKQNLAEHLQQVHMIWTVCDEGTEGAEVLLDAVDGTPCLYAARQAYQGEAYRLLKQEFCRYRIRSSKSSGNGAGFGEAGGNTSETGETEPLAAGCAVVENGKLIGACMQGRWEKSDMDGRDWDHPYIYLPIGGEPRKTESVYSYQVYVFDGTSSEYTRTVYAAVEPI